MFSKLVKKLFKFFMRLDDPKWEPDTVESFVNKRRWGSGPDEKNLQGETIGDSEEVDMVKANGEVRRFCFA